MMEINKLLMPIIDKKCRTYEGISFFVSWISIVLAITYWLARYGFAQNSFGVIIEVLGLSFFLIYAPDLINLLLLRKYKEQWYFSRSFLTLICLILMSSLGMLPAQRITSWIISTIGLILFLLFQYRFVYFQKAKHFFFIILFAFIFSLWAIGAFWGYRYQNPLFFEKILIGTANLDTLFLTGLSSIIKTYNISSTGLNGLPYLSYHWGSSAVFVQISKLLRIDVLSFYNLCFPVIFIPFLLKSMIGLSFSLRKYFFKNSEEILNIKFFIVLFACFAGLLPLPFLNKLSLWIVNILNSESYLVSLSFAFLSFNVVLIWAKTRNMVLLAKSDFFFGLLFIPLALFLIGVSKVSILFLMMAVLFYLFVRLCCYKKSYLIAIFIVSLFVGILTFKIANPPGGRTVIELFSHINRYVDPDFQRFYIFGYYAWMWAYLIIRLIKLNIQSFTDLKNALKNRSILDIEILLVIAAAGFLPGAITFIGGGSAIFFSDIQRWCALILLLAYLPSIWPNKFAFCGLKNLGKFNFQKTLIIILLLPFLLSPINNTSQLITTFLKENLQIRKLLLPDDHQLAVKGLAIYVTDKMKNQNESFFGATINAAKETQNYLNSNPTKSYKIIALLKKLSQDPSIDKKKTALFVPQDNYSYWGTLPYRKVQFIGPIISEMAMIDGVQPFASLEIPESDMKAYEVIAGDQTKEALLSSYEKIKIEKPDRLKKDQFVYRLKRGLTTDQKELVYDLLAPEGYTFLVDYGYSLYTQPDEREYLAKTSSDGELCTTAKSKGFANIIPVTEDEYGEPQTRIISCN